MRSDKDPFLDVVFVNGRICRLRAGASMGTVLVSLVALAIGALLLLTDSVSANDLVKLLPFVSRF